MKLLQELAAQTILGTERKAPVLPVAEGAVGELLAGACADDALALETRLLRAAGILAVCADAGYLPVPAGCPAVATCPPETLAEPTDPALLTALRQIIAEGPDALRREACALLAAAGMHMPYAVLPAALTLGEKNQALRQSLLPVLGQRGGWLAGLDPAWAWAVGSQDAEPDPQLWENGTQEQRRQFIARLRAQDPTAALALMQNGFAKLDARERAGLLEQLGQGLSPADEDFIESCLVDRSKEVRQTAADLLARLPGSRYVQRISAYLAPCVTRERRLLRQVVTLEPPAAFAAAWKADAIEESRAKGEALGERAWWLYQLARALPLDWWAQQTGMAPAEVIDWLLGTDWQDAVLRAWAEVVRRDASPEWVLALYGSKAINKMRIEALELLAHLPLEQAQAEWLKQVESASINRLVLGDLVGRLNRTYPAGMPEKIALSVLQRVRALLQQDACKYDYTLRSTLPDFVCLIPPNCLDAATEGWPMGRPETEYFVETLASMLAIVEQRRTLYRTLSLRK